MCMEVANTNTCQDNCRFGSNGLTTFWQFVCLFFCIHCLLSIKQNPVREGPVQRSLLYVRCRAVVDNGLRDERWIVQSTTEICHTWCKLCIARYDSALSTHACTQTYTGSLASTSVFRSFDRFVSVLCVGRGTLYTFGCRPMVFHVHSEDPYKLSHKPLRYVRGLPLMGWLWNNELLSPLYTHCVRRMTDLASVVKVL